MTARNSRKGLDSRSRNEPAVCPAAPAARTGPQRAANWPGLLPGARIAATVLFGLDTLLLIRFVYQPSALNFNVVVDVLTWLVGLGAIILVWNGESSAFRRAQQGQLKT